MAYSGIHIKASTQGSLHRLLGVAQGKNIPASKEAIKSGDSAAVKKKKQFAQNSRKFNHSGLSGLNRLMGN